MERSQSAWFGDAGTSVYIRGCAGRPSGKDAAALARGEISTSVTVPAGRWMEAVLRTRPPLLSTLPTRRPRAIASTGFSSGSSMWRKICQRLAPIARAARRGKPAENRASAISQ